MKTIYRESRLLYSQNAHSLLQVPRQVGWNLSKDFHSVSKKRLGRTNLMFTTIEEEEEEEEDVDGSDDDDDDDEGDDGDDDDIWERGVGGGGVLQDKCKKKNHYAEQINFKSRKN